MSRRRQVLALRAAALLPAAAARRLAGPPPPAAAALAPDQALLLRLVERMGWPELERMSHAAAREESRRELAVLAGRRVRADVRDLGVPGVGPARLVTPFGTPAGSGLVVWLHGGGWVLGDLDGQEPFCRRLAHASGARVLAVTYRRAPSSPFPAAAQDAVTAVGWAQRVAARLGADPARVGVGGDSAGGNLAAVAALAHREVLAFQVLLYPITDCSREHPSYATFADGPWLTAGLMRWFRAAYLPGDEDAADPRASPLLAPDLAGAPPAYVGLAGIDPLRDEGRAYARRLGAAGVPVTEQEFPGQLHGYADLAGVSRSARAATLAAAAWIRARLA